MIAVAYGGGTNSAAMMVGLMDRGDRPNLILFADTGGELPETYQHVAMMSEWLVGRGFPEIVTVRHNGKYGTLENQCNVTGMLPSVAYGGRSCSIRWKQDPQHSYLIHHPDAAAVWKAGGKVEKLIGYDAGEARRGLSITEDDKYTYRFPLKEWGWDRPECEAVIKRAGLCVPPKSSCFFCPAMKKREVLALAAHHPGLFARAVEIEENAIARKDLEGRTDGPIGLGIGWSWAALARADAAQARLFNDPPPMPCMCRFD